MKRWSLFSILIFMSLTASLAQGYKTGDTATDFKLKNVDGKMVSLSDYTNAKGFIVVFTCNACPYAKAYQDRLIALDKKYKALGYPVIAINPNDPVAQPADDFESMKKLAKSKGYTFPYLVDEGQKVYPVYGATKTPHVFVLQKTDAGNVVRYTGTIDDNYEDPAGVQKAYVADAVDALLAGQPVAIATTKAIGCGIKAKK